jgi:hypothetical protein
MAQPALREAETKSAARAAHQERAVKAHASRAANQAPKLQPKAPVLPAGGASLDAATFEVAIGNRGVGESDGPPSLSVPRAGARQRPW